jgi:hypothetical protein
MEISRNGKLINHIPRVSKIYGSLNGRFSRAYIDRVVINDDNIIFDKVLEGDNVFWNNAGVLNGYNKKH